MTLLCGFNQYTLLQNRDNSGLLGTLLYCSLKLGGDAPPPPMLKLGCVSAPPAPLWSPPCYVKLNEVPTNMRYYIQLYAQVSTCGNSTACCLLNQEACCSPLLYLASLLPPPPPPPPPTHPWRKLVQHAQNTKLT